MPHVYLSYSRMDADFVDLLQDDLHERGHPAWRDTSNIAEGVAWDTAIDKALADAYALVVVMSPEALASDWVRREIGQMQAQDGTVILTLLREVEMPGHYLELPIVDFTSVNTARGLDQLRQYRLALKSLIELLDQAYPVRRYVMELAHTDDNKRERAAKALGKLGDQNASEPLIGVLADADADVRFAAAAALGELGSETAVRPLIRLLENDDDADVRATAATALGQIGMSSAITPLISQLEDRDRFVRAAVLWALGYLHAIGAVQQIIHIMRNDPISDVRRAAELALCVIDSREARRALRRAGISCEELAA